MMKKILFLLVSGLLWGASAMAKDGYKVEIKFKQDVEDGYVYLAHYYAKPLPTIYKTDSAKVINKRSALLQSKDSVLGGIYLLLFNNNGKYIEFILDNGTDMAVEIDTASIPANIVFKNSPENTRYVEYEKYLMEFGKGQQKLMEGLAGAKNAADSQKIRDKAAERAKELTNYRQQYAKKHPGTFLSNVFNALEVPAVPEGPHFITGTQTPDSNFAYYYYKDHYWDKFDFSDNRLMYTPIYDAKLDEYFNKLVLPLPDTMIAETDVLLKRARKAPELFKYTLHWLAGNAERSNVMGMDEVFVHLVEKYYMKGDAFWLDSAMLAKYTDRAQKIAPNVLGNIAPDLNMQEIWGLKDTPLSGVKSKYTLLLFWSKDCTHCVKEIPAIDSLYKSKLKAKGVTIYAVSTQGNLEEIQKVVKDKGVSDWINVVDIYDNTKYRNKYDVFSTPKMYLLDENKKLIGKGLDHTNISELIDWQETRKKGKK